MRIDVITLFPEFFGPFQQLGVVRRAFSSGALSCQLWPLRDFAQGPYKRVDDRVYGGGPGMVLMYGPLARALSAVRRHRVALGLGPGRVILFSPVGKRLHQSDVQHFVQAYNVDGAVLVCGRYEGMDQRFIDRHVDEEISIGDYVLSGGELPAIVLLDAVARLMPGVLGDAESHRQDSHSAPHGLLDWPHYSRPASLGDGLPFANVPAVLLGGNHQAIADWRHVAARRLTCLHRPDLLHGAGEKGPPGAAGEAPSGGESSLSEQKDFSP